MGSEWQKRRLEEVGVNLIDCVHATPPASAVGYPYIAIPDMKQGRLDFDSARQISEGDLKKWTAKAEPIPDDVVLSRRCNPGETAYVPKGHRFALGQNLVLLRSNDGDVFPPYLRWLVQGEEWWNEVGRFLNVGAVFDSLRCADVPKFELPIPPRDAQSAIDRVLRSLDDKIELLRQMNETLEGMARALFKSWFVDFEPVRKKADGLPTGLPKEIEDLFPGEFEDSELGEIPKGWMLTTVGELTEKVAMGPFGSNILVSTFVESGVPVISGKHLGGIFVEDSDFKFLTPEHSLRLSGSVVRRGDIVVTHAGTIGQVSLVPSKSQYDYYNISQRQFFVRPMQGTNTANFLTLFFQSENGQHLLLANASQVGVPSISRPVSYLRTVQLVLPSTIVRGHFQKFTDSVFEQMQANCHEVRVLSGIRDSLLPKLISGDLNLTDEMITQILEPAK
jgi:type I restriction enzyme S subunit